jgi:hypothetical protein
VGQRWCPKPLEVSSADLRSLEATQVPLHELVTFPTALDAPPKQQSPPSHPLKGGGPHFFHPGMSCSYAEVVRELSKQIRWPALTAPPPFNSRKRVHFQFPSVIAVFRGYNAQCSLLGRPFSRSGPLREARSWMAMKPILKSQSRDLLSAKGSKSLDFKSGLFEVECQ